MILVVRRCNVWGHYLHQGWRVFLIIALPIVKIEKQLQAGFHHHAHPTSTSTLCRQFDNLVLTYLMKTLWAADDLGLRLAC